MGSVCTQHLMAEHREIEAALGELERFLEGLETGAAWTAARRKQFTEMFRFLVSRVASHIEKEHQILFPALESFLPPHEGPLEVLRSEHVTLESQILRLSETALLIAGGAAELAVQQEFARVTKKLIRACHDHIYKEDKILFPMVARLLPAELDSELLSQMRRLHEASLGQAGGVE
jgi:hemerythrin-like domain-containing protein